MPAVVTGRPPQDEVADELGAENVHRRGCDLREDDGGGGAQYLVRLMGRARALEVMLSADDHDAELAERYGWINRALPANTLGEFVTALAHRIAGFPAAGHHAVKERVNALSLAPAEDFRRDSDLFGAGVRNAETQRLIHAAFGRGLQTPDGELALASMLADLDDR